MIYFVESESGHIKIGYCSTNMYARLNVIQNGCPYKVKLIKTIKGSRLKERAIQKNFKKYNVMREWFIITDELLEFIKNPYFIPGERAKRKRKPTWLQGF